MAKPDDTISIVRKGIAFGFAMLVGGLSISLPGTANAAEMDCGDLAAKLNPGDRYQFKIELQKKSIRLEKGDDFCSEPVNDWFARKLILPPPARDNRPRSAAKKKKDDNVPLPSGGGAVPLPSAGGAVPLPGQIMRQGPMPDMGLDSGGGGAAPIPTMRVPVKEETTPATEATVEGEQPAAVGPQGGIEGEPGAAMPVTDGTTDATTDATVGGDLISPDGTVLGPPPVAGVIAPPPPEYDPDIQKNCKVNISDLWAPGEYNIDGQMFWLSGVFTIDFNGDGRVDDVGFKINAEGKIGNVLNYFPSTEGRLSGKTVPSLRVDDERDIGRLCADNVTFVRPGPAEAGPKSSIFESQEPTQSSARQITADTKAPEPEPEPEIEIQATPEEKTSNLIMWMGLVAGALVLFGIVGFLLFLKRAMSSDDDDEYEDDEYDDDEYEDEDED